MRVPPKAEENLASSESHHSTMAANAAGGTFLVADDIIELSSKLDSSLG